MVLDLLTLLIIFIFGLCVGSFLNVIAYRSVKGGSVFYGRSECPHCKHILSTVDLVPLLSFIFLRGRCRYCQKRISWQYPIVELSVGLLFVLASFFVFYKGQDSSFSLLAFFILAYVLFVISILIIVFVTDLKSGLIPDKVILPSIGIVLILKLVLVFLVSRETLILPSMVGYTFSQIVYDAAAGIVAGAFFFFIVLFSKGKGMGGGDIKYALFLGFALGFANVAVALFIAFLTGAAFSLILILRGKKRFGQTVAFGPFLSVGAVIALLWGQQILDWYLRINR
jgi:prepilin signal peptidase PulO-like enzyme (type II secretory pathway)